MPPVASVAGRSAEQRCHASGKGEGGGQKAFLRLVLSFFVSFVCVCVCVCGLLIKTVVCLWPTFVGRSI